MDKPARVVFMSASDFGIPAFKALLAHPQYEVAGLVTQPDRPAGRGRKMSAPPIKRVALSADVPVLQPQRLRDPEAIERVKELKADVIVVAAYGQWIPPEVYDAPPYRTLNIHPSLLPRHRGAAPAMSAILAGDQETGVTIILVGEEMDAGDILEQVRLPIAPEDTTGTLMDKLAELGAQTIVDVLPRWLNGEIQPTPQDHTQATWFRRVRKSQGLIDWTKPAEQIWREVRAYNPWPSAYTFYRGRRLVIHQAWPLTKWDGDAEPGEIQRLGNRIAVATGEGALLLDVVQLAGKRPVTAEDFARGQRALEGTKLGRDTSPAPQGSGHSL